MPGAYRSRAELHSRFRWLVILAIGSFPPWSLVPASSHEPITCTR
jgi:hypothetical protein